MTMLRCDDCGGDFDESIADSVEESEPYEFWGERGMHVHHILACPFCGGTELDDRIESDQMDVDQLLAIGAL